MMRAGASRQREETVILILPAFVIIVAAVILVHLRKERLLAVYAELASKGYDTDESDIYDVLRPLREIVLTESLRRGILSSVLGAAVFAVAFLGIVEVESVPHSFLKLLSIVVAAHGCGNLIVWFVVDRPRMTN
jgi:hypothetical protein